MKKDHWRKVLDLDRKFYASKHAVKNSLRYRMTCIIMLIVCMIVFLCWIINKVFLPSYYEHYKSQNLGRMYEELNDAIEKEKADNTKEDSSAAKISDCFEEDSLVYDIIDEIQKYGVEVCIYENIVSFNALYPNDTSRRTISRISEWNVLVQYLYDNDGYYKDSGIEIKALESKDTNKYIIAKYKYKNDSTERMMLYGLTYSKDAFIILESDYASIGESAKISNRFLMYIGIIVALIASIVVFFISRSITRPILELSNIARKMAELDFDVEYEITTHDEIGTLGKSMNMLSGQLKDKISELKLANIELQNDIEQKTKIDEMRRDFLSNISHELKTPIALVQGYAEGLKDNINDDEESKEFYCEVIIDEARKMNNMVKKMLDLNHLEFGDAAVSIERFDIVALIKGILTSTEILFKKKETRVVFEQKKPIYVWADEFMIEEVVTNYISNALNHIDGNKIVEIKLIQKDDIVRVAVFNTGKNIPEKDLDRVWEKFYKVDKARTREYGGSGVGLAIVKVIIELHNKKCGVINRERGVEFWFELDAKA